LRGDRCPASVELEGPVQAPRVYAGSVAALSPCLSLSAWHFRGLSGSRPDGRVRLAGARERLRFGGRGAARALRRSAPAWRAGPAVEEGAPRMVARPGCRSRPAGTAAWQGDPPPRGSRDLIYAERRNGGHPRARKAAPRASPRRAARCQGQVNGSASQGRPARAPAAPPREPASPGHRRAEAGTCRDYERYSHLAGLGSRNATGLACRARRSRGGRHERASARRPV
jgi:hypothetical protein